MILGWLRLFFFVLIGLTVIYLLLAIYFRSVARERLEDRWRQEGLEGNRDSYIALGMASYERGLKRRLLWLVFILPVIIFHAIFFYVNWV